MRGISSAEATILRYPICESCLRWPTSPILTVESCRCRCVPLAFSYLHSVLPLSRGVSPECGMSIRPFIQPVGCHTSSWNNRLCPRSKPYIPLPAARAAFHTTSPRLDDIPINPYEALGLTSSATQADIKKQFFELSKLHHPDHNLNDPKGAAARFTAISDAYHRIGTPAKRKKFDRENGRNIGQPAAAEQRGSYGSRSASGLSRRRGAFRGPPPSFYRNGGWGANTDKWSQGASSTGGTSQTQSEPGTSSGGPYAGTGEAWPFKTDPNDVPHFNREGHYRTTSTIEEQLKKGRTSRRQTNIDEMDEMLEQDSPANIAGRFFMVIGLLGVGIGGSLVLFAPTRS